jgi:hypothetical protein
MRVSKLHPTQGEVIMNNLSKLAATIGLLSLCSVLPLRAQSGTSLKFTTPFAFYVGNTMMPSGSYILTQPDDANLAVAVFSSADGLRTANILVNATASINTPERSKVIFEKYGDRLYFDRAIVDGSTTGVQAERTKAEEQAEERASAAEEHSVNAYGL